ncbi:hypothetical protein N0V88_000654 [Collariella sp. IMI 366227]|nr:hypothetical protein N0V88_000654 [Collariella sp. IMI 366227]
MAVTDTSVRRRKPDPNAPKPSTEPDTSESESDRKQSTPTKPKKKKAPQDHLDDDETYSTATLCLDIFRVLVFLFLASCGLSYLISNGETYFWGMSNPPKYLRVDWWKQQFVHAARAFVTGCFAEDRTADLRGVEEMYLPIDDPDVDSYWTEEELEGMRRREREEAKRMVQESLSIGSSFWEGDKYRWVGYVKREEGWEEREPVRELCEAARKGRKRRVVPGEGYRGGGAWGEVSGP